MSIPSQQVDSFIHGAGFPTDRWDRLYERGITIARLKGFCAHTRGCAMASQSYDDRLFNEILGREPKKCTCGLNDLLATALAEAEAQDDT